MLRFLITAGPTREYFDPVRFISNRSSGQMGYALAAAARAVSDQVVLVTGPTALTPPAGVTVVPVVSAQEMAAVVWARFAECDVAILCAAVCDWRPKQVAPAKLKKDQAADTVTVELERTPDILAELGRRKTTQVLVGFAAETENVEAQARDKLWRKNLDWIVANDASAFETAESAVWLLGRAGQVEALPRQAKTTTAEAIIQRTTAGRA